MSSTSTPTPERDAEMLSVGHQCSEPLCRLVDFLPFKCQHCNQAYCGDHFLPAAHKCAKYDESQHNRVAPQCPLCNTPIAIPPRQDPNIRMERHFTSECEVMTGKAPVKKNPTCANRKCNKVLYSPIKCDTCKQQFCPQHRFPNTHDCSNAAAAGASAPLAPKVTANMNAIKRSLAARANAAAAAASRSGKPTPSASAPSTSNKASAPAIKASASSSSRSIPFSPTDRSPSLPSPAPVASQHSNASTLTPAGANSSNTCADDLKPKRNWLLDVRPPPSIFGTA